MAGLLKNQILKPLSRFVKNLSPDKIKISAIKGEGDLTNLELDEEAIMELLDLPTWLLLNKVTCNKVSIKIQWTSLKSKPIFVYIDKVFVEIEVLEEPRPLNSGPVPSYRANSGKYGLIDRVIDGIKVSINSVKIVLKAPAFKASLELSRLMVASKLPNWKDAELKFTSIRDTSRNSILLFKEIYWETTRIEADALQNLQVTPVKLITNTSRIRITMKKRLSDCAILTSRVQLLLDDLLWVLTVSQMEAAVLFLKSLQSSILKSSQQSKTQAQEKIKRQTGTSDNATAAQACNAPTYQTTNNLHPSSASSQANQTGRNSNLKRLFDYYDVQETSYHLYTGRVELHFCEEGQEDTGLSKHSVKSGAIRFVLSKINLDFYPFHNQSVDRSLWSGYADFGRSRDEWLTKLRKHQAFLYGSSQPASSSRVLMESVFVLRMNEIQMGCVSTPNLRKTNDFFGSDKDALNLPPDTNTLFLDYTEFYYSDNSTHQVPAALLYCQVNPFHLRLDLDTIVWLNAFYLNLSENLEQLISLAALSQSTSDELVPEMLFRVEATLPRIILPPESEVTGQLERPNSLQIQASTVILGNILPSETPKQERQSLYNTLDKLYNTRTSAFFRERPQGEAQIDWKYFESSVSSGKEANYLSSRSKSIPDSMLKLQLNQLWIEFVNSNESYLLQPRVQYFLDSIDVNLWLLIPGASPADNSTTTISILLDCAEAPKLRLDHYQLLYLYRLMESMTKLGEHIAEDSLAIISKSKSQPDTPLATSNMALACNLPFGLSLTFTMPTLAADIPAQREAANHTPGSLFQFVKENHHHVMRDPLNSLPTPSVSAPNTEPNKYIARTSSSIPLVSEEDSLSTLSAAAPSLVMSAVNHSDTELNSYYNNTKELPATNLTHFASNSRYSQSSNQLSPGINTSSVNAMSPRMSPSPVMRGGRRTPTGSVFSGTFNQSVNRLGSTFTKFGGKLKQATIGTASGNSSNYGDEEGSEDWEHLSMAGSEFSDSDDERLIAMMTADLELDQGYAPGGVAQGMIPPTTVVTSRPGSTIPGQFTIEVGGDAACLMDGEESCMSSLTNRSKHCDTVAFVLANVKLYTSSTSQTTRISITVGDCAVEESARGHMSVSRDHIKETDNESNKLPSVENLLVISCDIPAMPSSELENSQVSVSQTDIYLKRDLSMTLLMSSMVNLADLFEDEILPPADLPFSVLRIVLEHHVNLLLNEDRPCTNLTCPGDHQKIVLRLRPGMQIFRGQDGALDLLPPTAAASTKPADAAAPSPPAVKEEAKMESDLHDHSGFSSLIGSEQVNLDSLTVVSCGVKNRQAELMKSELQIVAPSLSTIGCQTLSPQEKEPEQPLIVSVSTTSSSAQCNIINTSSPTVNSELEFSSGTCIASAGNFSSFTPSQELLAHYYTENVKLREKITTLRRERGHLAEQLAGCRQALEDSARERKLFAHRSTTDYTASASTLTSSSMASSSLTTGAVNHSFIPTVESTTSVLDSTSLSSSNAAKLAAKKAIL